MKKNLVFMFSGQGSHYYQMGRELFEGHPVFRQWMIAADHIYQELTGLSLTQTLYNETHKKSNPFSRTLLSHPAIFSVEHALGQVLLSQGLIPDYVLGTSLGEFAAAVFAGVLTFETALQAVIKQAQLLEEKCPSGSLLAILHTPELYDDPTLREKSTFAAINFHSHFVISGSSNNLDFIEIKLKEQEINFQRLAVSHGFHSPLIDAAAPACLQFLNQQILKNPIIPFFSCAHEGHLARILPSHFWDSIRLPIQFQDTIKKLEEENNFYYLDVGPSGTLATFAKYNITRDSFSQTFSLLTPFGEELKNLTKLLNLIKP